MISQKKILELLHSPRYKPMKTKEMSGRLEVPPEFRRELTETLLRLQESGEIVRLPDSSWEEPSRVNMLVGRLDKNPKGFGFVVPASEKHEEDVFIPEHQLGGAMDGDLVIAKYRAGERRKGKNMGPAGRVIKILRRAHTTFVGTFRPAKGKYDGAVSPYNPSLEEDVFISRGGSGGAKPGDKVLARITGHPDPQKTRGITFGEVMQVLGKENTPEIDELSVIHQFDLPEAFPPEVEEEARGIPFEPDKDDFKGREDLSETLTIAVDPDDAKDCDDALSMFFDKASGEKVVLVHIADVSCRVKAGSRLDGEARKRGLSVYLVRSFIPMLPVEATQQKLSLAEGGKRPAKTVELRFDRQGALSSSRIFRSIVKLDRQLTYGRVQDVLGDKDEQELPEEIRKLVRSLDKLACRLRARRQKAGSVDLDVPEYDVKVGEDGKVSAVSQIERDRSHGLVEEFMLAANVAVAKFLNEKKLPAIYRIHEKPEDEDLEAFADFVETVLGKKIDPFDRKDIQNILAEVSGTNFSEAVNMELLKCMKRARYSPECSPHFALHFPVYCHFTSPIRRYPDLIAHRVLDEHFDGALRKKSAKTRWDMSLEPISRHCSAAEEKADKAEREIIKIKLMRFLEERGVEEDEVFEAVITGVKEYGFFAQLKDFSIEGLVRTAALKDDFYEHKPDSRSLEGRKSGRVFRLGSQVRLKIEHIDMANRRLDFKLAD